MARIFGIDLGTTHSLIAYSDQGSPRVIPDPDTGSPLLPSVVAFPDPETVVVGAAAKPLAALQPLTTIASVKRFMGLGVEHVSAADRDQYPIAAGTPTGIVQFQIH